MLWLTFAAFFLWLALREIYFRFVPRAGFDQPNSSISLPYVATTVLIAAALAYTPFRYWKFEQFLTAKARVLAESDKAHVHCNTFVDSVLDTNVFAAGHADLETGRMVLQHPWCGELMDYLAQPATTTLKGIQSVHLFAHEAMHVRGELNEATTDCQAIQRYSRAATLLGVPEALAKQHGMTNYTGPYLQRGAIGGMAGQYFSAECAPGKALDENLVDSIWR